MKRYSRYESRNDLSFGVVVLAMFVVTALGAGLGYFGHADESAVLAASAREAVVVSSEEPQNPGANLGA
jgi:hypothetical protein